MKNWMLLFCLLIAMAGTLKAQNSKRVNAKMFYSLTQKSSDALVIDVRPTEKFEQYRIKNAVLAPEKCDLIELTQHVSKTDTIFIYCEKDIRTRPAAQILEELGFTNIIELKGGLISWRRNGLPLDDSKLNN